MKGRNAQMTRVFKILTLLENHRYGLSAAEISSKLAERGIEVSKRTVYRDLDALKVAGFPLDMKGKNDDQGTRWTLEKASSLSHHLILSSQELWGLYFARKLLSPLEKTPFYDDLVTTFEKIEEKLGTEAKNYLGELEEELKFDAGPQLGVGISSEIIDTVKAACGERQVLSVTYASAHSQTTRRRKLGPYFLYFAKGSFYFVAEDLEAGIPKTFSVSRILEAELLDEVFEKEMIQPSDYFSDSFGVFRGDDAKEVVLRFSGNIAPYIKERIWHKSQEVEDLEDGVIALSFNIALTPELIQWIVGFGKDCLVVQPEELKKEVVNKSLEIVELYRDKVG